MKKLTCLILSLVFSFSCFSNPFVAFSKDIFSNNDVEHSVVHDPSIVKSEDGNYYIVGSHLAMYKSDDMVNWSSLKDENGNNYSIDGYNYLGSDWKNTLKEPLLWTSSYQSNLPLKYNSDNFEYNCWANNIIYNKNMEKYCLYGCCSVWGTTASVIWLCTADDIEGPYEYVKSFVYSGINKYKSDKNPAYNGLTYTNSNIKTDIIDNGYMTEKQVESMPWFNSAGAYNCALGMCPNAIDPTAFFDKNGNMWMVYGSYSGGCYIIKLDKNTGLPDYDYMSKTSGYDVYFGKQISKTNADNEGTGEGPFIVYDKISGYYYFFLTYGGLAGDGGYNIREYRSKTPDGPYKDACGYYATDSKNTGLKLDCNYKFSCQPSAYLSGGHSSCLVDSDGSIYQVYHTRYMADGGNGFKTVVHKMLRTNDGWTVLSPYEYQGEKNLNKLSENDVVGIYEFVDSTNMTHRLSEGADLSTIIVPTQRIALNCDGTVSYAKDYSSSITNANTGFRNINGSWSILNGTCKATFVLGNVTYNCVFLKQYDESENGNSVLTFSGAGSDNSTVMAVKSTDCSFSVSKVVEPSCKSVGYTLMKCENCNLQYKSNLLSKLAHNYKLTSVTKATASKNGSLNYTCSLCNRTKKTIVYYSKTITLSKTSYTYDGKSKTPAVTVKDSKGNKISAGNYTVSYGKNKNVGTAQVKVTFKGNYSGSVIKAFTINPKNTSISKLSAQKKGFKVNWKKITTQTTGYQIRYSVKPGMTGSKCVTINKNSTTSKSVSKLSSKKKYYVQVRTFKTVNGKKYYSAWSKAKSVTTKK